MPLTPAQFFRDYGRHIARTPVAERYTPVVRNLDIPIADPAVRARFRCFGLAYPGVFSGVIYHPGYITYMKLPGPYCGAISYEFSGCYMAKLCFRGEWYVMHIGTAAGAAAQEDCRTVWMDFLNFHKQDISHLAIIKPNDEPPYQEWLDLKFRQNRAGLTVAGLFDGRNRGYSLVYDLRNCRVADNDARRIVLAQRCLLTRAIDKMHYYGKTF